MHACACVCHLACVELPFKAGASAEVRRKDGSTPLIVAAYFGHAPVVDFLLFVAQAMRRSTRPSQHARAHESPPPPPGQ